MNKWKTAVVYQRCRAKSKGLTEHFTLNELLDLVQRTGCKCAMCNKGMDECTLSVDHIIPLSRGGTNTIDNIQILCTVCNSIKSDKSIGLDIPRVQRTRKSLFCSPSKANIHVRVSEEQKKLLADLANDYGKSITEMIVLMAEYIKEVRPTFHVKPTRAAPIPPAQLLPDPPVQNGASE